MSAAYLTPLRCDIVAEGFVENAYQTTEPFRAYSDILKEVIEVAGGFYFDGESAPWPLKKWGFTRRAACIHDWLYKHGGFYPPVVDGKSDLRKVTRAIADKVYLEFAMLTVSELEASLMSQATGWKDKLRAHVKIDSARAIVRVRYAALVVAGGKAWNGHREKESG